MFKVVKKYTRSTTKIPFHSEIPNPVEISNHIKEKYVVTGKFISSQSEYSQDKLILTQTLVFKNKVDFSDFIKDEFLEKELFGPRQLHDMQNEITNDFLYIGEQ